MVVDYYLALTSPFTYMGHTRFVALAERSNALVRYRLVDVERVFSASGTLPVKQRPAQRRAYRMMELKRWRRRLDLPMNLEPTHFPVDQGLAARVTLAAMLAGEDPSGLIGAFLRAVWEEERNIADPETTVAIAEECGLDGAKLVQSAEGQAVQEALDNNTEAAISDGVFGLPTWKLGEELFWGQDRLDFIEETLVETTQ